MNLLLHGANTVCDLSSYYKRAFKNAVELFVVTAYLTDWDATLELNPKCRSFRVITGRDFGITRKAACEKVMRWLPPKRKAQFMVADRIGGFHPKAVFWKEEGGRCFGIIGSSNLTEAAFGTNYEANVFVPLPEAAYLHGKAWVKQVEKHSVVMSGDWLKEYKEAPRSRLGRTKASRRKGTKGQEWRDTPLVPLDLPRPRGMEKRLEARRKNLAAYKKHRGNLMALFRWSASGRIKPELFYQELPKYWSSELDDRLTGPGWEIKGKHSDFTALSKSFLRIIEATDADRDDVVQDEIDALAKKEVPTRGAFLSEMLCLRFPEEYPVLNKPVQAYLRAVNYRPPRPASEGSHFISVSNILRTSLRDNPDYPAKNLAELDTVIWLKYGKK